MWYVCVVSIILQFTAALFRRRSERTFNSKYDTYVVLPNLIFNCLGFNLLDLVLSFLNSSPSTKLSLLLLIWIIGKSLGNMLERKRCSGTLIRSIQPERRYTFYFISNHFQASTLVVVVEEKRLMEFHFAFCFLLFRGHGTWEFLLLLQTFYSSEIKITCFFQKKIVTYKTPIH